MVQTDRHKTIMFDLPLGEQVAEGESGWERDMIRRTEDVVDHFLPPKVKSINARSRRGDDQRLGPAPFEASDGILRPGRLSTVHGLRGPP
jgi:hypothetical protein